MAICSLNACGSMPGQLGLSHQQIWFGQNSKAQITTQTILCNILWISKDALRKSATAAVGTILWWSGICVARWMVYIKKNMLLDQQRALQSMSYMMKVAERRATVYPMSPLS